MILERDLLQKLVAWKTGTNRKPLILQGARQTGKTYAMQIFGERYFEHTAYFNFEETDELTKGFEATKDVKRLLVPDAKFYCMGVYDNPGNVEENGFAE